jgi:hypothetical protein
VKLICQKMADAVIEGRTQLDASSKEASPEDMGYAPATPTGDYTDVGTPRAKRTPRVYEPEEDEDYPLGGQRYEEPAEEASAEATVDKKEDE